MRDGSAIALFVSEFARYFTCRSSPGAAVCMKHQGRCYDVGVHVWNSCFVFLLWFCRVRYVTITSCGPPVLLCARSTEGAARRVR